MNGPLSVIVRLHTPISFETFFTIYFWRFRSPMEAKLSKTYPHQEERAGKYFVPWKWQKQVFRLSIRCKLSIVWILTLCRPIWGVSEWTQQPCLQHLGWWMNNPLLQVRDIAACHQKATKPCQPYTQRWESLLAKAGRTSGRTFCGDHHHHHKYFQ